MEKVIRARQAVDAMIRAAKNGEPLPEWAKFNIESKTINNSNNINILVDQDINIINNINTPENRKNYEGLYAKIYSDLTLAKALDWGVGGAFLYAAVRDFGYNKIAGEIHRIDHLRDMYFQDPVGIPEQRGKVFNSTIMKMRGKKR